jgi:hypothetical protein
LNVDTNTALAVIPKIGIMRLNPLQPPKYLLLF